MKCTCISEADPDISIRGIRFISETIFFSIEISRDTETLFSPEPESCALHLNSTFLFEL
jgi:hypothetical protein